MESEYLLVEEYGAFVGKHSERLQVRKGKEVVQEIPLLRLDGVIVSSKGVSLSADAIAACAEAGIPIHFLRFSGQVAASVFAAGLTGTVQTRRAQLEAAYDNRGVTLAKAFAQGKIANQAALIRYLAKYRKERQPALYDTLEQLAREMMASVREVRGLAADRAEQLRPALLSAEGRAAEKYWQAVGQAVQVPDGWKGRGGRGASDPLNAALNYGYGILYSQAERAVILAGLDPYAGFIHADRPGKPSLVLDLVEEFRAPVVDRAVFALFNRGTEIALDEEGLLVDEARRAVAEQVLARLEKPERYGRKKMALRQIIQYQARHIATFVRLDRASYEPFLAKW